LSKNKLILDTDGGVDDAQALIMLIGNGRAPDAITTVFGNVGLDAATTNILAVLAVVGANIPVYAGADRPVTAAIVDAKYAHGEDGLGGATRPVVTQTIEAENGVDYLRRTFRQAAKAGQKVDILMIGPLTNLALAVRTEPSIVAGIGTLTIMGGTVYGRGNITPAAEFNIYADPEAAHIVFGLDVELVLIPWEACTTHTLDGKTIDAAAASMSASTNKTFSTELSSFMRSNAWKRLQKDCILFVDPLAAATVIDPTIIIESITASIGVGLGDPLTRGMTVIDPTGRLGTPKYTIVEKADLARVASFYIASVAYQP
jgi:purine nucleosidase